MIARLCHYTGNPYTGPRCDCPKHAAARARDTARRANKPQRKVWDTQKWRTARKQALRRDHNRCRYTPDHRYHPSDPDRCCQPAVTVHHTTPVSEGGRYDPATLVSLCRQHHGMLDGRRAKRP